MKKSVAVRIFALALMLGMLIPAGLVGAQAQAFATPEFQALWNRTDSLVANGTVKRSYYWGPAPISGLLKEPFAEATGGQMTVQYFDKSRMELAGSDKTVTNGLLAVDLISGRKQIGKSSYQDRYSADIPMASDGDDKNAPTYATFKALLGKTTDKSGQNATATINKVGTVGTDATKASDAGTKVSYFEAATGHNIPAVFVDFLNAKGPVLANGQQATEQLSNPTFYASGLPISEAYWAKVKIAGKEGTDVLIQAFERRIVTYVPSAPEGFKVQVGNIGQHYYDWVYKNAGQGAGGSTGTPVPAFSLIAGGSDTLNASGATFPKPLYDKQFAAYKTQYNVTINYAGGGSGKGKSDIAAQTVDFAGSDSFLSDAEIAAAKGGPVLHIPTALGAVVIIYNLPGFSASDKINLTGENIADIYLGVITKWDDAKIKANNPGISLPSADIVVVHRSDGSGTSNIFSDYLAKKSAQFKNEIGVGTAPKWKDGQIGGNGNQGVSQGVTSNAYAIGYVELNYAIGAKLPYANVKNLAGKFIEPTLDSVTAAADGKKYPDDLRFSLTEEDGDKTYPICAATWLVVYQNQTDKAKATALFNLLWWSITEGQKFHKDNFYAPLPAPLQSLAWKNLNKMTISGQPVRP